ncbi:RsmB/NOP family class I SAM-dependent RNA methyltransferase [Patescibacteria group bacterium]|nr:RsmB/NOP family class I SAM-dependent RNA methyltransferase [Patescibacteria group bacterium]
MKNPLHQTLYDRLRTQFGDHITDAMVKVFGSPRKTTFRVNTIVTDDASVMETLRNDAIAFERVKDIPHAFVVKNKGDKEMLAHPLTTSGKIYLQGIASQLPPLVLAPTKSDLVLDLCAAPGSKTSQMAALMHDQGTLIACEENDIRVQKLQHTLDVQRVLHTEVKHIDSTRLPEEWNGRFTKILADVPCSAEGRVDFSDVRTFKYWSEKNITEHAKLQRRLLRAAVRALAPGGELVYSTCTLAPQENEQMITWLLTEFPELSLQPSALPLKDIKKTTAGTIVLPTVLHEGFFVAKVKKSDK